MKVTLAVGNISNAIALSVAEEAHHSLLGKKILRMQECEVDLYIIDEGDNLKATNIGSVSIKLNSLEPVLVTSI